MVATVIALIAGFQFFKERPLPVEYDKVDDRSIITSRYFGPSCFLVDVCGKDLGSPGNRSVSLCLDHRIPRFEDFRYTNITGATYLIGEERGQVGAKDQIFEDSEMVEMSIPWSLAVKIALAKEVDLSLMGYTYHFAKRDLGAFRAYVKQISGSAMRRH